MNTTLTVILFGLAAAVSWGISDFLAAKSARSIGPVLANLLVNCVGALLFATIYTIFFRGTVQFTLSGALFAIAAGVLLAIGGQVFYVALKAGPVSLVSPLSSTYPIITTLLAILAFHGHLSEAQIVGVFLTMLGVMVASGMLAGKSRRGKLAKGPALALVAALIWGFGFALLAQAVARLPWPLATLIEYGATIATLLVSSPIIKKKEVISLVAARKGFRNRFVYGSGVMQLAGFLAISIGVSRSAASGGGDRYCGVGMLPNPYYLFGFETP